MARKKSQHHGRRRQPKPGKPGWYKVRASDLLHSIELRHDLKAEVVALRECIEPILKKKDKLSAKDKKKIKDCLDDLQSATEPIAFGLDNDNP